MGIRDQGTLKLGVSYKWLNKLSRLTEWYFYNKSVGYWSYQHFYFELTLSDIGCQPTRLSDVMNLKNLKIISGIKLIFCFHWSYKKYAILSYAGKYSWPIWLVNLIATLQLLLRNSQFFSISRNVFGFFKCLILAFWLFVAE